QAVGQRGVRRPGDPQGPDARAGQILRPGAPAVNRPVPVSGSRTVAPAGERRARGRKSHRVRGGSSPDIDARPAGSPPRAARALISAFGLVLGRGAVLLPTGVFARSESPGQPPTSAWPGDSVHVSD